MTNLVAERSTAIEGVDKAKLVARLADDAKAADIVVLDVRGMSNITDYFVIMTGTSRNHLRALGKRLRDGMLEAGARAERVDGEKATNWVVFDYGNVVVHAMLEETRVFYDLERLWGDARRVSWN